MIFLDFKMLTLIEKESPFFDKETAKEHFTLNRDNLDDTDGFEALLDAGLFYNVYNRGYVGSIFAYQSTDGCWYMGGYAVRKRYNDVVEAIKRVAGMFDEIYAETRHRNAVFALLRAGFKWYDKANNLLIYKEKYK